MCCARQLSRHASFMHAYKAECYIQDKKLFEMHPTLPCILPTCHGHVHTHSHSPAHAHTCAHTCRYTHNCATCIVVIPPRSIIHTPHLPLSLLPSLSLSLFLSSSLSFSLFLSFSLSLSPSPSLRDLYTASGAVLCLRRCDEPQKLLL